MTRMFLLATLLGIGCAAQSDRAALAPTAPVAIASDLTATCAVGSQDSFAYDPAAEPDTSTCRRSVADAPSIELDADASAPTRARAVAEFLSGAPADPPVDRDTLTTSMRNATTAE